MTTDTFITKPSITRIARKAGIKSVSEECYPLIQKVIKDMITDVIRTSLIINDEQNTKTLMVDDTYKSIRINGYNIAQSSELGSNGNCK